MNRRMVLFIVCIIMRMEAVVMIPPLIIALANGEAAAAYGFVISIAALLGASLIANIRKPEVKEFYAREGFLIVALAWIVVSAFGALPFFLSGGIPSYIDSLFETVSGFTTTGATILTDIEALPYSLLYWRSFTHWLGGMGVLVFVMAIIPLSKNTGNTMHIMRAESPGLDVDKLVPRMHDYAKILYIMYIVMTAVEFLFLLAGGMPVFDSLTTSFSTAGTGGFSIMNDSMASYTMYQQNVVTVFMILFSISFSIFYMLLAREFGKVVRNQELWLYLVVMTVAIVVITASVVNLFASLNEAAHHVSFQVASIMSTTGFVTVDYDVWPQLPRIIIIILTVIGSCAGSTGGGIKMARVLLLGKAFVRDLKRLIRPRSVSLIKMNGQVVEDHIVRGTQSFLAAYLLVVIVSAIIISLDNFSIDTTVSSVLTCMSNTGPGLDMVGPVGNYSAFSVLSKLTLSADMLIGRLEIYPLLMLFARSTWKI